jgi:Domain of unknown function (DUF6504)
MVEVSANDATARRLKSLNRPRRIVVEACEAGEPVAVHLSGRRLAIESIVETWRIDDEWWRDKPISRAYWRVVLEDGRVVDVYRDLASGNWWRQAY